MLRIIIITILISILISGCVKKSCDPINEPYDHSYVGDVNLNGIAYEIADAVVFTNYYIEGEVAFTENLDSQITATDVNMDETPLTVADLHYLLRILVGDAVPGQKQMSDQEINIYAGDTVSISDSCAALILKFEDASFIEPISDLHFTIYNDSSSYRVPLMNAVLYSPVICY